MNNSYYKQPECEIELTEEILNNMDFSKVIYGERSHTGAMGYAGHVLLYVFDGKMIPYLARFYKDENVYILAMEAVEKNIEFFNLRRGGFGNGVLIKKDTSLSIELEKECLIYEHDQKKYQIYCSVFGILHTLSQNGLRRII